MNLGSESASKIETEIQAALAPRLAAATTRQEKTRETATLLFFGHGIYPSAKTVHAYTRHGSLTDINADLREFWDTLRELGRVKLHAPMLPESVTQLFSDGLAKVWELAMNKANAALDGEREEAAEQVTAARRETTEAEQQCKMAQHRLDACEAELQKERHGRMQVENCSAAQAAEIEGLQSAVFQWQAQAGVAERARQEAEERFSRELQAERDARARDAEMFEGEIRFAKMQIESARLAESDLREQLKAEKASREKELASYQQRTTRAEEIFGAAREELAELKGRHAELESRLGEMQDRIKKLAKGSGRGMVAPGIKRRSLR